MKFRPFFFSCMVVVGSGIHICAQSVEEMMNTGQVMLQRGAYSQAVTAFRKVISREPDHFEARANLGFAYLGWGRNSNAVEELKKAIAYNSRNAEVWSNLAIAYENLGRSGDAAGALVKAVELDPQNITARMNLATIYANAKKYSQAIAMYKKVIEMDGMNEEALMNISDCYMGLGQISEAKKFLKQTAITNPSNGKVHYELGNILWQKDQNLDEAIKEYRLAVNATPEKVEYYETLANALVAKGQKDEAVQALKTAMTHTEEVLVRNKIQVKIDNINGPAASTGPSGSSEKMSMKDQSSDLKKELGRKEEKTTVQTYNTEPVDIMGDLNDLDSEDAPALDLTGEAKKRAAK